MNRINYLLFALLLQIFTSTLTAFFYPQELVMNPEKVLFNPTIIFSFSFLIISSIIAYHSNLHYHSKFNGIIIGMLTLLPFVFLTIYYYIPYELNYKSVIAVVLTYSFSHLGGFREIIVAMLGVHSLYNFFAALNLTIFIHLLGFFAGDVIFLLRRKVNYGEI